MDHISRPLARTSRHAVEAHCSWKNVFLRFWLVEMMIEYSELTATLQSASASLEACHEAFLSNDDYIWDSTLLYIPESSKYISNSIFLKCWTWQICLSPGPHVFKSWEDLHYASDQSRCLTYGVLTMMLPRLIERYLLAFQLLFVF